MHYLPHDHTHPGDHDESAGPGSFQSRRAPIDRDYGTRAFTVGIGGPVGSGKTALLLALCRLAAPTGARVADVFAAAAAGAGAGAAGSLCALSALISSAGSIFSSQVDVDVSPFSGTNPCISISMAHAPSGKSGKTYAPIGSVTAVNFFSPCVKVTVAPGTGTPLNTT